MSSSLSSDIVYGYDIGGPCDGWKFEEYDDESYEMHWPIWMPQEEDEDPDEIKADVEARLLDQMSDFEEIPWERRAERPLNYNQLRHEAVDAIGIEVIEYGRGGSWSGNVLGFKLAEGAGLLLELDPNEFMVSRHEMDCKLRTAIEVLGLHPKDQAQPRLLILTSYWQAVYRIAAEDGGWYLLLPEDFLKWKAYVRDKYGRTLEHHIDDDGTGYYG